MANALIRMPKTAKRGEVVEIKTLIQHPMETGFRPGMNGTMIPRNIIEDFICTYNGVEVFRSNMQPGTAENPYLQFYTVATESGTLEFTWLDDNGDVYKGSREIKVT